jgi:hypothetical protein
MKTIFKVFGQSKRLASVAAFGTAGVLLTATWAAGVVSTPADDGTNSLSTPIVAGAPSSSTDRFSEAVNAGPDTTFNVDFVGRWGRFPDSDTDGAGAADPSVDYELFEIDLTDFTAGTYFVQIGMLPTPQPSGLTAMQVEFVIDDQPCATADLAGQAAGNRKVLFADNIDNSVVFSNLAFNTTQCVGVLASGVDTVPEPDVDLVADDPDASFVLRTTASTSSNVVLPTFVAIVNEHQ